MFLFNDNAENYFFQIFKKYIYISLVNKFSNFVTKNTLDII